MASFGIVDPIKQPHKLLRAFAALSDEHPDLRLALVGPVSTALAEELEALAHRLGLSGRVLVTGRVATEAYLAWLDRAEVAVQLRASFSGEASAAVGDCLARGVPLIVSDVGWMGELPDNAAAKVPVEVTPGGLAEACARLLEDPAARITLANGARAYADDHSFKAAASALLQFLNAT